VVRAAGRSSVRSTEGRGNVSDGSAPAHEIGWLRAILWCAGIVVVGIGVLVYGTNAALTKLTSLDRSQRVAVATTLFFVAFLALAFALRRLQRRGSI
jgi:hypothetical protein